MRIGIVTYIKTASCNYGAELQGYALQYILNKMGYDAEVINLHRVLPSNSRFSETVKKAVATRFAKLNTLRAFISVFNLFISVAKDKYYSRKYHHLFMQKRKLFEDYFNKYIKHSLREYYPEDIDCADDLPYNTYIAGSDQIWNYKNSDRVDVFFLMFARRYNAKCISYAASFSVSDIPESYRDRYKIWINNIDYLSVREFEGINIVKELTGRDAELVCDPTLLLDKDEWLRQFEHPSEDLVKDRYVLIYSMSRSRNVFRIAHEIAKRLKVNKIVNIKLNFNPEKYKNIENLYMVTPPQWLELFANAEYIVTDSFHGTAFSVNFNKPFTTIQNPMSDLNSRVDTLLTKLSLKDRLFVDNDDSKFNHTLVVDYTNINNEVKKWRKSSLDFIRNALNN